MGNDGSKRKRVPTAQSSVTKSTTVNNSKYAIILHCSQTDEEISTVENFQDALESEADGMIEVSETFNLAQSTAENFPQSWLQPSNNVVLICLPSSLTAVESIANVVRNKQFADKEDHLLSKVLAVSFGSSLPEGWPPSGLTRPSGGKKDFCFEKGIGKALAPKDFEGRILQSLIQTVVGMK